MKKVRDSGMIDMRDTMYPSTAHLVKNSTHKQPSWTTIYGIVYEGSVTLPNGKIANQYEYVCVTNRTDQEQDIIVNGQAAFFTRYGFIGQDLVGGPIESSGRLCYIDGCSDSLLVYPPRQGDPSLNLLAFPVGVDQTFHIHPSIRFGIVLSGSGLNSLLSGDETLEAGTMFCIEERETHRFRTVDNEMRVIAFHPDGDWGPTDENHTMLNRTYIQK